jgi:hypothetical protein
MMASLFFQENKALYRPTGLCLKRCKYMNQFDKNQIITLDIQDPISIKQALEAYQELLNTDKVNQQQNFDVEFKQFNENESRRLQPEDSGKHFDLLKDALNKGQEGGSHYYDRPILEDTETYISEVIVFAAALQFAEIRCTVVDTAHAIVAYCRRQNDTDEMWLDDMRVFGIEALYMLAKVDLQYAYLIGQYFVPNWDDEHACGYQDYLSALLQEYGWHKEIIKAFIWCDNEAFRRGMFMTDLYHNMTCYQPLGEYLATNPVMYEQFTALVIQRFQSEPVLLQHLDTDSEDDVDLTGYQPVVSLYQSLFPHVGFYDDETLDSFMEQPFLDSTLEDKAYDLQIAVQKQVSGPLVKAAESALASRKSYRNYLKREDRCYELNYGTQLIKPLILAMTQGDLLWRYIENGEPKEALESLTEVDVLALAKVHSKDMYDLITDHTCHFERDNRGIAEEINSVLSLVRKDLLTDHFSDESEHPLSNDLFTTLKICTDEQSDLLQQRAQQYLRVVDVFYYALGKRELSDYFMESLTDDYALLTREAYFQRFSQNPAPKQVNPQAAKQKNINAIFNYFSDMDTLLCKKHLTLVDSELRCNRSLCHPDQWPEPNTGLLALGCYHLYSDFNAHIGDDVTKALSEYLCEMKLWDLVASKILAESQLYSDHYGNHGEGLTESEIERVKRYFKEDTPQDDLTSLLSFLQPQLYRDDCCRGRFYFNKFSEHQIGYRLFNDYDEDFQRFTLIAFWLRQLPLPVREKADRLWQFIIALAPVRAARNVCRAYSDDSFSVEFHDELARIELNEQLEKAGIDAGILDAYEMSVDRYQNKRYVIWLDKYSDIISTDKSMFGRLDRKKAEAMHRGLSFINESTKIDFLHHAALKHPQLIIDHEHDFTRALKIFVQLNICSWEQSLAREYESHCIYYGEGSELPEALIKPIIVDSMTVHDKPCHVDNREWQTCSILQCQGDHYVIVMADPKESIERLEHRLSSDQLVILNDKVDRQVIMQRICELQVLSTRVEAFVDHIKAYLDGKVTFDEISDLFTKQIAKTYMSIDPDEYNLYSLRQFIWVLDTLRRDKLIRLLLNHDYRGFKLLENQYEHVWLLHQFSQQKIVFAQYLDESREREASEEGIEFMINWLREIYVSYAHLTLFCIKHRNFDACRKFVIAHARGEYGCFKTTLAYLNVARRAELPELLSQADDKLALITPLMRDRSRKVKEAVNKYLD